MPSTEKFCQGRINTYPRYHLVCRKPAAHHGANTPSAHNAGNASADTRDSPFPLPSAAHLLLRFSPHFHQRGLSVDAPATLLPPQRFSYIKCIKPQMILFVKHLFRRLLHHSTNWEFMEPLSKKRERKIRSLFGFDKYRITYRRVRSPERGDPLRSGSSAVPRDPRCRQTRQRSYR